ncbi:MAG: hypothetical protein V7K89_00715 [Nostoc sp.]|uniref:hypothetical protein n=1 Tax=Nostoc sp. TaxID=1180 RepID=UPI002FF667ED
MSLFAAKLALEKVRRSPLQVYIHKLNVAASQINVASFSLQKPCSTRFLFIYMIDQK